MKLLRRLFSDDSIAGSLFLFFVLLTLVWGGAAFLVVSQNEVQAKPAQPVQEPKKKFEIFQVKKVLAKAGWTDLNNQPGWCVVTTTEGETILRIHGGHDGLVWSEENEFISLDKFLKRLPLSVDKIMTCHPKQVRELSGVKQKFFYPNHPAPIYGTRGTLPGSLIRVYDKNPD